ncbi:MAG: amidohydrolase family protein [Bifidobacterium tibiigranuli]|jgi:predicted TIM-barrel fold metal-dependent hydrolase|uniref:amidohydrolase family protein n=1 Tax=Bifidobacterium tibiigranuli TaxID=2172043 RepID=UPI0026EB88D7|nr:amidohydrolase family protein [Bifidobacterium tibiigranuli]MCI1674020.1 amidohydrolase family protein [Bifidobacterium tibiigranuli]MCI1714008.1 amidohydrolase family protein [Bifidobacterium tibiigranuli]
MIIDAYSTAQNRRNKSDYLNTSDESALNFNPQRIFTSMDSAGVDMAMICSLAQRIENDFIAQTCRQYPDRFFGFGQVRPNEDDAVDEIHHISQLGLRGLKLHPSLHGYLFSDHGLLDPVFAACEEEGLMVIVNALDDAFVSPFGIEEIARGFPHVPTIIAHMGAVWNVPDSIIVAERNPNIYLDTSATMLIDVRNAYARLGAQKILMGTEWPANDFDMERLKIRKAVPKECDRALIEGGNIARLLGLGV